MARKADLRANGQGSMSGGSAPARLGWLVAFVSFVALVALPGAAQAACVLTLPNSIVCSGAEFVGQDITTNSAQVTTVAGFSVVTSTGSALSITGFGQLSYEDTHASPLSGVDGLKVATQFNNAVPGGGLSVQTNGDIVGLNTGIHAENNNNAGIVVKATGTVRGLDGFGIWATNFAGDTTDIVIEAADVWGGNDHGILAANFGTGKTEIEMSGPLGSTNAHGLWAVNSNGATDLGIVVVDVTGGKAGIHAENRGKGWTSIAATGTISGLGDAGLLAFTGPLATVDLAGNGLVLDLQDVFGATYGILVASGGKGATSITAGDVTASGADSFGILATNAVVDPLDFTDDPLSALENGLDNAQATDLVLDVGAVSGVFGGIYAENTGIGVIDVTAHGPVTSAGFGIVALNRDTGTDVSVEAGAVTGDAGGIGVFNLGKGATLVKATGPVAGGSDSGIAAWNFDAASTTLTVEAVGASGEFAGIEAYNFGAGDTGITTSGLVEGGDAAVIAASLAGNAVDINNLAGGTLRNLSGLSSDMAVVGMGGAVTLVNDADIVGTVWLDGAVSRFENNGVWNGAGGISQFGGGVLSQLVNAAGASVVGGADAAVAETTLLAGLPLFTTHGLVTLADGGVGDVLRIEGDADFQPGSTLAVDIGNGAADLFIASGFIDTVGATLQANRTGALTPGVRYTVLTAEAALGGAFTNLVLPTPTAFLMVEAGRDANNIWLEAVQYRDFADAALTPNQIATAAGLATIPDTSPLHAAIASLATDAQAQDAFDQLSGEIHAAGQGVLIEGGRFLQQAAIERLRAPAGDASAAASPILNYVASTAPVLAAPAETGVAVWAHGYGAWGLSEGNGNAASLERDAAGLLLGADGLVGDWRLGLLTGFGRSGFAAPDRTSAGASDNYHAGLYGGTAWGDFAFRGGAAYTWHDIDTVRRVAIPGLTETLSAAYGAGTLQAFGEIAYNLDLGDTHVESFANLAHMHLSTGGFTEAGGSTALASAGSIVDMTFTTLGVRVEHEVAFGEIDATFRGMVGWRHAIGDVDPASMQAFANGQPFTVAGTAIARDSAIVEAGLDLAFSPQATLGLAYNGQYATNASNHGVKASLSVKF